MNYEEMIKSAEKVSKNAYAPYSKFPVGACVLTESGKTYTGCNFENSSFGMTICAERNAVGSAIAAGEKKIKAVAIFSPEKVHCVPCGACRQVLAEFQSEDGTDVILQSDNGITVTPLNALLPDNFEL